MTALASLTRTAPPQGQQRDLLAAVLRVEAIGNALENGDELEALRIMRFHFLQGDLTRLCDHITPQTWLWAHRRAGDVIGEAAWLDYVAAELEQLRTRRPGLLGRWVRRG